MLNASQRANAANWFADVTIIQMISFHRAMVSGFGFCSDIADWGAWLSLEAQSECSEL